MGTLKQRGLRIGSGQIEVRALLLGLSRGLLLRTSAKAACLYRLLPNRSFSFESIVHTSFGPHDSRKGRRAAIEAGGSGSTVHPRAACVFVVSLLGGPLFLVIRGVLESFGSGEGFEKVFALQLSKIRSIARVFARCTGVVHKLCEASVSIRQRRRHCRGRCQT